MKIDASDACLLVDNEFLRSGSWYRTFPYAGYLIQCLANSNCLASECARCELEMGKGIEEGEGFEKQVRFHLKPSGNWKISLFY